jgi:tyrosyl-tRNA synthetase
MGGSDQWGNITAGIELASRRDQTRLHGLVLPLLTTASGAKFGKSEAGNVWLDPARTSPYQFHQYWLRADDADVERFLRFFTFLPLEEIATVMATHHADSARRTAQRRLADDVTTRVHGPDAVERVTRAAAILFGGDPLASADAATLAMVLAEVPTVAVTAGELAEGIGALDAFVRAGLADSKKQAKQFAATGALWINDTLAEPQASIGTNDALGGVAIFLRRGKKQWAALQLTRAGTDA